jgi:hypothetical protein
MSAFLRHLILFLCPFLLALLALTSLASGGEDWLPITPEELKMTGEPKAPGVPAIYLYRQMDRDDADSREYNYARLKIFTEEGRKYADIEIPFVKGAGDIKNIRARTIRPDGSIADFDGKVYEKMIVKAKGLKYLAKTFTLPDVQAGSIIEYRYIRDFFQGVVFDSQWLLSEELFTRHAKFSLHRSMLYPIQWSWPQGLPEGTPPPQEDHQVIQLETYNIPAFQVEDWMPPETELKYRVDFRYSRSLEKDPAKFWKEEGKRNYRAIEAFVDKQKAMERALAEIVGPNDTPEEKLHEIYARCQKIRNTTWEPDKTQKERDREKLKKIMSVEDIWKRGYGGGRGITWLFLALARAAGFDASPVLVSTRDNHFFNSGYMNADDLNDNVVLVKLNGEDLYFDPGTPFTPYGLLPWHETGVKGLSLDKDGGDWVTTALPSAASSGVDRKATLQLDEAGLLEGKVTLTFKGLSALWRRLDENEEDAAARKEFLEEELQGYIATSSEVELINSPDWNSSSDTLVAEFHVKVPGWASAAGRRTLLPVGLFGGGEKHVFEHAARVHPIYFSYAYEDDDDITVNLPLGMQISSLPEPTDVDANVFRYETAAESQDGSLHLTRHLTMNFIFLETRHYGALQNFYQAVRSGDDQQVVLSSNVSRGQD